MPTPGFGKLMSHDDVEKVIGEIGLPVVLKPSAGAGSEGVFMASTMDEVHHRFEEIQYVVVLVLLFSFLIAQTGHEPRQDHAQLVGARKSGVRAGGVQLLENPEVPVLPVAFLLGSLTPVVSRRISTM